MHAEHRASCGCAACGHEHHESVRLGWAFLGGILVLNSYVAKSFLSRYIDPFAIDLSAIVGALVLGLPIFWSAVKDLARGRVYMNELVALALLAAFAHRDYRTAGAVAFFMLITITIERRTAIGAEASIEALIRLTPRRARRLRDGVEEEVEALELQVGDLCRVRPGENFPADGTVVSGTSTVNQASITGESLPVDKKVDSEVYAGTQNLTGLMDVRVTRVGTDTTLGKVRDLIVAAEKSKLPIMRMIDQYVVYYTPTVLMIAALVWFFTRDLNRVIAVLVMSCPCALVIATPSAVIAAIAAAARLGILIKDVSHIELAAKLRAMVFDKTGTLTEGVLEVARLQPAPGVELAELLQTATSTEANSNHPAAQAMRRLAKEAGVRWEDPVDYTEVAGQGVVAKFGADTCRVGRETWLGECGLDVRAMADALAGADTAGMSIVFVARNDRVLGWVGLRDAIRSAAKEAVRQVKDLGIRRCCMFTGDNPAVAEMVAQKVGIAKGDVRAGCLPGEKVAFVEELKGEGLVAVVGDGVNDAPALAAGDVGIAMGAIGSDVAVQSASIALMNNDLRRIPFLIHLSRRARLVMNQNLLVGLVFILGGLYFSTIGVVSPVVAAVLHSVGSLVIIFNSARLVRAGEHLESLPPSR
ncbi:MAG: copper-translocating P-type ATPase [Lentisphaerae bacterium RIFOXYB12_FULL_65_16]|nr:MAG: copper-translocating P-type ATPase [Lentisphaerae bacterium RIFOXYA12_64_32]OGV90142.1 MAG: copper-translocating P-type ATPase [Lentisphaerae bacterium RIFOXYB12_FULL_65_16]